MEINTTIDRLEALWLLASHNAPLSLYVTQEDREIFKRRTKAEGLHFLTTVLPSLGKLVDGIFRLWDKPEEIDSLTTSTQWNWKSDSRPTLLKFALNTLITSLRSGDTDSAVGATRTLRQLSYLFYKLEVPMSKQQEREALSNWHNTEDDLQQVKIGLRTIRENMCNGRLMVLDARPRTLSGPQVDVLKRIELARYAIHHVLGGVNPFDIHPKHGSGSSACSTPVPERYETPRWCPQLNLRYPYEDHFFLNRQHFIDDLYPFLCAPPLPKRSRMTFVPKDSRGPRIISMEPRELMFIQQGQMRLLYETIDQHPRARKQTTCTSQEGNRQSVRRAHIMGYATLDLKEASDRVTPELVEILFPPAWYDALMSTRSHEVELPDGTTRELNKFAPMGSAVCFPVEALVFWALTLASQVRGKADLYAALKTVESAEDPSRYYVRVFGDDIICPALTSERVISTLEFVGLKVNVSKSYTSGPFRESCGIDVLYGYNVTPVRLKYLLKSPRKRDKKGRITDDYKREMCALCDHFNMVVERLALWRMETKFSPQGVAEGLPYKVPGSWSSVGRGANLPFLTELYVHMRSEIADTYATFLKKAYNFDVPRLVLSDQSEVINSGLSGDRKITRACLFGMHYSQGERPRRHNRDLQTEEILVWTSKPKLKVDKTSSRSTMLRWFLTEPLSRVRVSEQPLVAGPLEGGLPSCRHYAVPNRSIIKSEWLMP